jgi:hypothetical protein
VLLLLLAVSCSSAPDTARSTLIATTHEPPKDNSTKFPLDGQSAMQVVPDHLLGKEFMPGGNLATYKNESGEYQIFLVEAADPQKAAFKLLDWKETMPDAKYLAHMGGYAGTDHGKPVYVFTKGPFLVGLVGLPEDKADIEARRFAARL